MRAQSRPSGHPGERDVGVARLQPVAAQGDEEARRDDGTSNEHVTAVQVVVEHADSAGVQWELARLAVLAVDDREHRRVQVDVFAVQRVGLTRADAGHRQQTDQRLVGQRVQARRRRSGRLYQRGDIGVGEKERGGPVIPARQQISRWNLVAGIESMQVGGQTAYRAEPIPVPVGGRPWRGRPRQRPLDRDVCDARIVEVAGEVEHEPARIDQREPEGPAQGQIVLGGLAQRGHDVAPGSSTGQGRASAASALRSTLA